MIRYTIDYEDYIYLYSTLLYSSLLYPILFQEKKINVPFIFYVFLYIVWLLWYFFGIIDESLSSWFIVFLYSIFLFYFVVYNSKNCDNNFMDFVPLISEWSKTLIMFFQFYHFCSVLKIIKNLKVMLFFLLENKKTYFISHMRFRFIIIYFLGVITPKTELKINRIWYFTNFDCSRIEIIM